MVLVLPRNKTDELLRREAIGERETPEHPDVGYDSEVEHVNGPKIKSQCARGSLEWQRQQEHANADPAMQQFADEMLAGRDRRGARAPSAMPR